MSGASDERLRAMLLARVIHRFDYARPHSSSLDDLLASIRPQLLEHRREYFRAESRVLELVIEEGRRDGAFEVSAPSATADAMVSATNALLPYSLSVEELGQRSEIVRRADAIVHLLLRGIVAGQSAAPQSPEIGRASCRERV